jgi:hypothetical protein
MIFNDRPADVSALLVQAVTAMNAAPKPKPKPLPVVEKLVDAKAANLEESDSRPTIKEK